MNHQAKYLRKRSFQTHTHTHTHTQHTANRLHYAAAKVVGKNNFTFFKTNTERRAVPLRQPSLTLSHPRMAKWLKKTGKIN